MHLTKTLRTMIVALLALFAMAPALTAAQESTPEGEVLTLGASDAEATDIRLVTRDPETGKVIPGACYELIGYSNIGCDEDGNGTVDFAEIPYGTYTVHQTTTPEGYEPMGDYEIDVQHVDAPGYGPAHIVLIQAESQGDETAVNFSVVILDEPNQQRLVSEENCLELPGMTNVGCDDDLIDGQVDFIGMDTTRGQLTVNAPNLVCPYGPDGPDGSPEVIKYGEATTVVIWHVAETGGVECED